MSGRIHLASRPGEVEIAVVRDGALIDHALWRPGAPDGFGDLHVGRVTARVASLGGAFVRLEGESTEGFLPDKGPAAAPLEGALVGVRIIRSAHGGKGPKLEAAEAPAGDIRLVARGPSPLDELRALHATAPVETADRGLAARLRGVVVSDAPLEVVDEVAALRDTVVLLPGGAVATITPTPALVAIDVDSAAASEARAVKQVAQFAANRALLAPLLHQIRLRNLSGAILVDLAGLAARKRVRLAGDFTAALAEDPKRPRFLGFTALGLAEIVRVRTRPALHELLRGDYAACLQAARHLLTAQAADPHRTFGLRVTPALSAILARDPVIGADLARLTGRPLFQRPDPSLAAGGFVIEERR